LQALGTIAGKFQRFAGDVRYRPVIAAFGFHQAFRSQQVEHARAGSQRRFRVALRAGMFAFGEQAEVQQAMAVVEGRAEQLAARQVLEGRRDPPGRAHLGGFQRHAVAEAGQGGAVGPQQEDGFEQVASRLLDRQRSQLFVEQRAFGHDPRHRKRQLLADLADAQFG